MERRDGGCQSRHDEVGMWRSAFNYMCQLAPGERRKWRPLLAVYYLTHACDFRCPYCSNGQGVPYWAMKEPVLDGPRILELLRRIRAHCDWLVITGGEPTLHPEVGWVLERIGDVGFDGVIFTTNGHRLAHVLPLLRNSVHELVFSVDTLDAHKADRWFNVGEGAHERIMENIERAREVRRGSGIVISTVLTPDNLGDVEGVYRWARSRGFQYAAAPQLMGVKANPALARDGRYAAFFNLLIDEKRRGERIVGSVEYLEGLRDLAWFRCVPSTVLAVGPTGDVYYPCLEMGQVAGNLLDEPDLHAIRAQGRRRFGPEPTCDTQCHSACSLSFSVALTRPASVVGEALMTARGRLRHALG